MSATMMPNANPHLSLLMGQLRGAGQPQLLGHPHLLGHAQLLGQPSNMALLQLMALQTQNAQGLQPYLLGGAPTLAGPLAARQLGMPPRMGATQAPHSFPSGTPGAAAVGAVDPAASGAKTKPTVSGRKPLLMYTAQDEGRLTPYQVRTRDVCHHLCVKGTR